MLWLALAAITACSEATKDLVAKVTMRSLGAGAMAWGLTVVAALLLGAAAVALPFPELGPRFVPAIAATVVLYVCAVFLYMKALRASDLSLTLPMIAFTPAFMLATGPAVLGEMPSPVGIAGVVTIAVGAYVLNLADVRKGALAPLRALAREPGPRYMLGVAFLFSITATTAKISITESSPLVMMACLYGGSTLLLTAALLPRRMVTVKAIAPHWKGIVAAGLLVTVAEICLAYAITLTLAVYVISVKRLSILVGAVLGFAVLKERNVAPRLLGAAIMLAGLLLITLGNH